MITAYLRSWRAPTPANLVEAVHAAFSTSTTTVTALVYTPEHCLLGEIRVSSAGDWSLFDGVREHPCLGLGGFEARVFDGERELRWVRDPSSADGFGSAVLIAEDEERAPVGWTPLEPVRITEQLQSYQLLWGTFHDIGDTVLALRDARIGSLSVPSCIVNGTLSPADKRLAVEGCEYVAVEPLHGNAYIIDERLVRVVAFSASREENFGYE